MKRKLPERDINGTTFIVDVFKEEIRQLNYPENRIRFSEMLSEEEGLVFQYDTKIKNVPDPAWADSPDVIQVKIPPMTLLDPVGMAKKYADEVSQLHLHVTVDQQALAERFMGKQPTLKIGEEIFYVDLAWGYLRPQNELTSMGISIREIEDRQYDDDPRGLYTFDYDRKTYEVKDIDFQSLTELPTGIVRVMIPKPAKLDPVGHARKGGWPLMDYLKKYPVRLHHEGIIVRWENTGLKKLIRKNVKAKQSTDKQTAKQKRGKGI